jgi:hypothetical protein
MNFVYSSTYITANLTDYICKKNNLDSRIPVLINTSLINIVTIAYKDIQYSKLFNSPKKINKSSYGLFALRDVFTIGASFVLKKDLTNYLHTNYGIKYNVADFISSITLPVVVQLFNTPIHILSIDLMQQSDNNPMNIKQKIEHIKKIYWNVCIGRMIRVVPAFGIGGFINDMIAKS